MGKKPQSNNSDTPVELRALAEERLQQTHPKTGASALSTTSSPEELLRIIHELSVHQIELEIQQDELARSRIEIEETLDRYSELYDFAPVSHVTMGRSGTILRANLTAAKLLGVDRSRLSGMRFKQFVVPEDYQKIDVLLGDVFTQRVASRVEIRLLAKDTEFSARPHLHVRIDTAMPDADGECMVILSDISEQKKTETKLEILTRALLAINNCNQALIHATDENELLQTICTTIVTTGGYRMAWIGYAEHDNEKTVRPVAQAGYDNGYIRGTGITWAEVPFGQGPTGTAIRTGQLSTIGDIQKDPSFSPWCSEALKRGYASVQALPLRHDTEVYGAITIYSERDNAFNAPETQLLSALADNIAYGISKMRTLYEKQRAENELLDKQKRFSQVLESTNAGVWEVDFESGENIWSDELWDLYGLTRGDEKPSMQLWLKSIHPDDRDEMLKIVVHAERHQIPANFEYRVRHLDGTVRWLMAKGMPIFDENGSAVRYIGTCIDITDRKLIELERERLIDRQAGFENLLNIKHIGLWELDLSDNTLFRTLADARIFGYDSTEKNWRYETFLGHVLPDERAEVDRQFKKAIATKSDLSIECRIRRTDGEIRWIWVVVGYQYDKQGHLRFVSGITHDITMRKLFELESQKLQAKLQHSQQMQVVGQLAGGIAHDFNNMLMVILGHTELALERKDSSYTDLKVIEKAASHSAELTRQLLAFARRQSVTAQILDLNAAVEDLILMMRRLIGENITLTWIPKVQNAPVKIAPSQVGQILSNLCVNARDAIEKTGHISIETVQIHVNIKESAALHTCSIPGDYISLSITDNGHGIDKKLLPHIMEPFFTTKEVGKGTGMGLSTVYGIVKQNNGFIDIESEKDKGTRIRIYLPLQLHDASQDSNVSMESTLTQGKDTILLVEDGHDILHYCRQMLENKGYSVLSAASPLEALKLAKRNKNQIKLLVTDVVMPEMNGSDLFKELEKICRNLKVVYMSAYTSDFTTRHIPGNDKMSFIEKPFTMAEFNNIIKALVNKLPENEEG